MIQSLVRRTLLATVLMGALTPSSWAQAAPSEPSISRAIPGPLRTFATPEKAADALTEAIRKDDNEAVSAMLGDSWQDLVPTKRQDEANERAIFLAAWDEAHEVKLKGDNKAVIEVGKTGFEFAIPIVKEGEVWRYDIDAGWTEIQARSIGHNELSVVQTLLAIVDAEHDYLALDPMKTGIATYARGLQSSPRQKDGLYWEARQGEPQSPLGPLVAKAQPEFGEGAQGYFGYNFRMLDGQGPAALGGAHSYRVHGRMIGGFAVIAWPVEYGMTGVMTFIVSHGGDVYEQDFGPDTAKHAPAITLFNPDKDWHRSDMTPP
jgi:Protein of unknown function (DUF2950)